MASSSPLPPSFFFIWLLACLLVEDQTVKPETPMSMYMPMSMNTFLHCIRSVSYSSILVERLTRLYELVVC